MPPATTTTWPVTCPESSSEESTTTWRATSSGWPTFRKGIVRVARRTRARIGQRRAGHRRLCPAWTDGVYPPQRGNSDDLVLQAEQEAVHERRLRGRIVGVPGLAEEARRRADEDEAAVAGSLHLAQERAGRQVGNRQVPAERLLPALERQLPDGDVLLRPLARHRGADIEPRPAPRRSAGRARRPRPRVAGPRRIQARRRAPGSGPRPVLGPGGNGEPRGCPRRRTRARRRSRFRPMRP